jgi:hypothetical protein
MGYETRVVGARGWVCRSHTEDGGKSALSCAGSCAAVFGCGLLKGHLQRVRLRF